MSKTEVKYYRREWYCSITNAHYSETRTKIPEPHGDYCSECAVRREEADWLEVSNAKQRQ